MRPVVMKGSPEACGRQEDAESKALLASLCPLCFCRLSHGQDASVNTVHAGYELHFKSRVSNVVGNPTNVKTCTRCYTFSHIAARGSIPRHVIDVTCLQFASLLVSWVPNVYDHCTSEACVSHKRMGFGTYQHSAITPTLSSCMLSLMSRDSQ
eukprot:3931333-Amphidinium_carterae.1